MPRTPDHRYFSGVAIAPIPGTRNRTRLEQNVAAASVVLDTSALDALEPLAREVAGIAV